MPAAGGFEVEPATIAAAAAPLAEAGAAGSAYGHSVLGEASSAAACAGEGPLAGVLQALGARTSARAGELGESLAGAASTLTATAENYVRSDAPMSEVHLS